jgi:hypothetical protein
MPSPLAFMTERRKETGIAVEHRSEEGRKRNVGLEVAAEELMTAVEKKDVPGIAIALENAFYLLESIPHEEEEMEEGTE